MATCELTTKLKNFKDSFKYYKSRDPCPDFTKVIDFRKPNSPKVRKLICTHENCVSSLQNLGLKPTNQWIVYELSTIPGLLLIKNPFTIFGQRYWILKCLKEFSAKPNKLNIDAHNLLSNGENWWEVCFKEEASKKKLLSKLRWATLGYHHNWDSKLYSEDSRTEMSEEICVLIKLIATFLGYEGFKAEAAIINYYRMNSTLAGHTDYSEINIEAPLFSISFGQSAIFLIGGHSLDDPAEALLLRSGDILVMSKYSRLSYHGVPRILPADFEPWENSAAPYISDSRINEEDWCKAKSYIRQARINLNVRQVLKNENSKLY